MQIESDKANPRDLYKLLIGCVVPRPIAWVSTISESGAHNIAPFSFFTAVSDYPPMIAISIGNDRRNGEKKDTTTNIEASGELVVNIVNEELADKMNITATEFASDVDEFEMAKLTPAASLVVRPPRIAEAPVSLECKVQQTLHIGNGPHTLVIAEVVCFHVRDDLFDSSTGRIDMNLLHPIARMAGHTYSRASPFQLQRPEADYAG